MKLHDLSPTPGSRHSKKRVGRGPGSGLGKTAGRGEKGQKSRSGYSQRVGFEGGQMPLLRRVPKRGFTNIWKTVYSVVNVGDLARLEEIAQRPQRPQHLQDGERVADGRVTPELLAEHGLVRRGQLVKVLGDGEVSRALQVTAHRFSKAARAKIEAAGGSCEELKA